MLAENTANIDGLAKKEAHYEKRNEKRWTGIPDDYCPGFLLISFGLGARISR